MGRGELVKVVYIDQDVTKVLRGRILEDGEFLIKVEADRDKDIITIGKRAIVKISNCCGGSR